MDGVLVPGQARAQRLQQFGVESYMIEAHPALEPGEPAVMEIQSRDDTPGRASSLCNFQSAAQLASKHREAVTEQDQVEAPPRAQKTRVLRKSPLDQPNAAAKWCQLPLGVPQHVFREIDSEELRVRKH